LRALVFDKQLTFRDDYPEPVATGKECLIKVRYAGICSTDVALIQGYMGFAGVLGHEMVGEVVSGPNDWVGKRVACEINCVCQTCPTCQAGLSNHCPNRTVLGILNKDGCFADFVTMPIRNLHEIPDNVTDEEAVFVEPLAAAWQVIKQVPLDERMHVSVVGSGKLGLLIAQVISTLDCRLDVIGRNPHTLELAEKKHIQSIDMQRLAARQDRDVVIECTGSPEGLAIAQQLVRPRGTIVLKSTYADGGKINLAPTVVNEVNIVGSRCGPFADAIASLARRQIDVRSMISRTIGIERGLEAFEINAQPNTVKVLLKINP
jgi:threonine dehydrogenase-like Zn-dependent dehydrogenase